MALKTVNLEPYEAVTGSAEPIARPPMTRVEEQPPALVSRPASLAQMLRSSGKLDDGQIAQTEESARRSGIPLAQALVRHGLMLSWDLAAMTALHMGVPLLDLRGETIDLDAVALLPEQLALHYLALPIRASGRRITVAMTDPTDVGTMQDLSARTGRAIDPVIATVDHILEHIDLSYRSAKVTQAQALGMGQAVARVTAAQLNLLPPADVMEMLVQQALQDRASDVHLEPTETHLRVRYRIDGILHDVMSLPLDMHPALLSRLKITSGLNIAERRRPQDGQFSLASGDRTVDVRVAISSTVTGEMAVLRLLAKQFDLRGLDQLGMSPGSVEQFRKLLHLPYGIIIVCGPTGAGKSTTLYASVLQMDRIETNVITLEDPVEYHIADVNQMQVHPEAGVTFATQLRSILRLDPDVILIGEIRDQETALIATQAALTGHLVLTSLHANDAVSALLRLRDLGVASYLIASSVAGIVSQRMVRRVCTNCGTMQPRPIAEQEAYAAEMGEHREQFVSGKGCNACAQTGYRGRSGIYEVMSMTDQMREAFSNDATREELVAQARADGMISMRRDGMMKVSEGITTPYEMLRVLFSLD
ncbi:MAG: type II/IV secretion system protein [Chloroflexi bacterium]|nr:type II/IV secretion system protein [Chloroflexota bacterium]MCH7654818.1 type II/IV secretion system protein [Chloroflexota bacterium]